MAAVRDRLPSAPGSGSDVRGPGGGPPRPLLLGLIGAALLASGPAASGQEPRPASGDTVFHAEGEAVPFRHADHANVGCVECHSTEEEHGRVTVSSIEGCRSCHHAGAGAEPCAVCHEPDELARADPRPVGQELSLSVGEKGPRELPFSHATHDTVACAACHADGPDRSAASLRCAECHEAHHRPEARCAACHREAAAESHPLSVHAGCTGSGCHAADATPVTAATMNRSPRSVCLACHQELEDHRPERPCAGCHRVSPADTVGGM